MGGKISPTRAEDGVFFYQIRLKMDQIRLERAKNSVFAPKISFLGGNFVCRTYAFGGNNSE